MIYDIYFFCHLPYRKWDQWGCHKQHLARSHVEGALIFGRCHGDDLGIDHMNLVVYSLVVLNLPMFTPSRTSKMELATANTWKIGRVYTLHGIQSLLSRVFFSARIVRAVHVHANVSFQHGWNPHGLPECGYLDTPWLARVFQKLWVHHDFLILWPSFINSCGNSECLGIGIEKVSQYQALRRRSGSRFFGPMKQGIATRSHNFGRAVLCHVFHSFPRWGLVCLLTLTLSAPRNSYHGPKGRRTLCEHSTHLMPWQELSCWSSDCKVLYNLRFLIKSPNCEPPINKPWLIN